MAAAKRDYGTILANVDWLHGSAESMLTVTNLLIGNAFSSLCGLHSTQIDSMAVVATESPWSPSQNLAT